MSQSIWPRDVISEPRSEDLEGPRRLRCFVLVRSEPKDRWDDMFSLITRVCDSLRPHLQVTVFEVRRAIDIVSSGVIHHEIWGHIQNDDVVIADVTGHNPNVMFELGVAAAAKSKQRVILMREKTDEPDPFPFDVMPARHITYSRTFDGFEKLRAELYHAIFHSLVGAPFDDIPDDLPRLPFSAKLDDGQDNRFIWTCDVSHRRMLHDSLEFGSLYWFNASWASVANLKLADLRVRAEMKLTRIGERPEEDEWIGISVRNQGFYANFGWLVHVVRNGIVRLTMPEDDMGNYHADDIGQTQPLDDRSGDNFVSFDISVGPSLLSIRVDDVEYSKALEEMPFVYPRGRILFQAAYARAGLRRVQVEGL